MKILLLGEYSNVHATLALGLRALGHTVTVASNGDFWKGYPRDISLVRKVGKLGGMTLMAKICAILPRLRDYDVVQLINPMFVELKAERIFSLYRYLRRHNGKIFLGAFGMDYYWVKTCVEKKPLHYSDFNIGDLLRTNKDAIKERRDWMGTTKQRLNEMIANDCDGIITGLYEYWVCYHPIFPHKTTFIPFPINDIKDPTKLDVSLIKTPKPIKIFIGINRERNEYKGTDIMLSAARDVAKQYPNRIEIQVAESVPFTEYTNMMEGSDIILDQLYSYTPSMNSLEAMAKGIVCVGGGEKENYEILNEHELQPIINVVPTYESVRYELEQLALHPERIPKLKYQSIEYIHRHHHYIKVAQKYEAFYKSK